MGPLIQALLPMAGEILDRVIPDEKAKEQAKHELEVKIIEAANQVNLEQAKTNQVEASHRSIWVAGWRPAIGWACALGISWAFVLHPFAGWILELTGGDGSSLPQVDSEILFELVLAMLGMSGLRTFEKMKKVTK